MTLRPPPKGDAGPVQGSFTAPGSPTEELGVPNRFFAAIRAFAGERGLALPYAIGVTFVVGALGASIFTYVTANQKSAARAAADARAFDLAEAGLSYAYATLINTSDPLSSVAVPTVTVTLTGGTTTYSGTLTGTLWTLTGTGQVPNPSGPGSADVVRTVSTQAQVSTSVTADMRPWDYLFVDQPSGCLTLGNYVTMDLSLYVRGDLCLENIADVHGPAVNILGRLYVNSPQAQVGSVASPIPSFKASGSCHYNAVPLPCGPATHVYANSIATDPPSISKPAIDLVGWYVNADLGPTNNCTTGSFPGGFDNNLILDVSRGDVDITPSTAYDCRRVVNGETVGRISWTPGSPGTLTIHGVIYFDGNLTWSNLNLIQYDGMGVIYASGQIVIRNRADMCGVPACDSTWDPQTDLLVLIAGSLISTTTTDPVAGEIGNQVNFQGAIYTVTDFAMDNNTTIWGPVITRNASIANSALLHAPPRPILWMNGMPGNATTELTVSLVPGSYSG
jgi:Tfp pilus assembly protein PilX